MDFSGSEESDFEDVYQVKDLVVDQNEGDAGSGKE